MSKHSPSKPHGYVGAPCHVEFVGMRFSAALMRVAAKLPPSKRKVKRVKKVPRPPVLHSDAQVAHLRWLHEVEGISRECLCARFGLDYRYAYKLLAVYTIRSKVFPKRAADPVALFSRE